ncbi:hypothetical protein MLD38_001551 [Melastoma candidum]|uniref:Uncharacterized protein n=1 Tax=Melastoma candidum TaxID=119954 RepID=A0ACB9SHK2_9MYRT|nr:hypothetical protein MLD38_001551 [Melastoma candidum]
MGSSSYSCFAQLGSLKAGGLGLCGRSSADGVPAIRQLRPYNPLRVVGGGLCSNMFGLRLSEAGTPHGVSWSFAGGWRVVNSPSSLKPVAVSPKCSRVVSSWVASSQLASVVFTVGTISVLPFYTLMIAAPKAEMTRKCIQSCIPFIALGLLYAYLLYLSWTPDTLGLMFASKYWLPELPGIARMFSNEMTLASAWIHLLVVDLFAARQIFHDGLENEIETRHSVSLCLLFCPIGIMAHFITKALMDRARSYQTTSDSL